MDYKIDICAPLWELTEEEIKYTLRNKYAIIVSIHEKMHFIKKEIAQADDMIRTASFRSSEIIDMPSGNGNHRDLTDVLLKYYKYMDVQKNQYTDMFWNLIEREKRTERIWMCFLLLEEPYYTYLKRLYVDGEKYEAVEQDSGFSRQVFAKYRKEAVGLIIHFYYSEKSMPELHQQAQRSLIHRDKKVQSTEPAGEVQQITMEDILKG